MNRNVLNFKTIISILLVSIMTCSLASCGGSKKDTSFLDQVSTAEKYTEDDNTSDESTEVSTEEGYTATPVIESTINIAPDKVIVAGTCEEGAVVTAYNVADKNEVYSTKSLGNYFILELSLSSKSEHNYNISAKLDDKEESKVVPVVANYDAVAEKPHNAGVSLGNDCTLFYDKLLNAYKGQNLYTNTQLENFRKKIKELTKQYKTTQFVFVTVPGMLTTCPEKLPQDIVKDTFNTKYDQIVNVLSQNEKIKFIDMKSIFAESKDYPLYYNTSSNLSDYGSYLVYMAIMDYLNEKTTETPEISESSETDNSADDTSKDDSYKFEALDGKGGDLISNLGLTPEIFTEKYYYMQKLLESVLPEGTISSCPIGDIKVYDDLETNKYYTSTTDDAIFGACENLFFKTNREDLPTALFLRDDTSNVILSMLAEQFNNSYFAANDDFSMAFRTEEQMTTHYLPEFEKLMSEYAGEGDTAVDYVFVILSEDNIEDFYNDILVAPEKIPEQTEDTEQTEQNDQTEQQ